MLFNSSEFIFFFLPVVIFIYYLLNSSKLFTLGKSWLVVSSLFFYSFWNVKYLIILLASLLINYSIGYLISDKKSHRTFFINRKYLLFVGVLFNIALLVYYKYSGFILSNLNATLGIEFQITNLVLPLAISFFTFQQVAYLVDTYKGKCDEYDFLTYSLFVTFFPQLIAGPIVHHSEMMPQFKSSTATKLCLRNVSLGLAIFSLGLFKKVVIADQFSIWANQGFDSVDSLLIMDAWLASISYTFQLYYDFSGYADMAMGIALLFNIRLPFNFNSPYKARNIQEFWQCWHMTLSRWLKDYVYIPLGGNRCNKLFNLRNLFLTAFISGIWHGAGWTFIVWGSLHGIAMVVHRLWAETDIKMNQYVAWFLTFNFINVTWVFFRAESLDDAITFVQKMFGGHSSTAIGTEFLDVTGMLLDMTLSNNFVSSEVSYLALPCAFLAILATLLTKNSNEILADIRVTTKNTIAFGIILGLSITAMLASKSTVFLYFNF